MCNTNLKSILDKEGLSQIALSIAAKVSQGTVNKASTGARIPSLRIQNALVKEIVKLSGSAYKLEDVFPNGKNHKLRK
jgi:transcriptional regulator with XRE-family HTH domain